AAFLGHLYPLYFRFRGGKGVATAFGCLTALSGLLGLCIASTWLLVALLSRYSSLAALVAASLAPIYAGYFCGMGSAAIVLAMSLWLIVRHRTNINKLWYGQESKI